MDPENKWGGKKMGNCFLSGQVLDKKDNLFKSSSRPWKGDKIIGDKGLWERIWTKLQLNISK